MPTGNLELFEPTYSVSDLCEEVRGVLGEVFRSVWVAGEIARLKPSARGHVFFELVEKGPGDSILGKLEAVIWKTDWLRIERELRRAGSRLTDGLAVRLRGGFDLYPPQGRLQLVVRDVDPSYTLGELARRRHATLAALAEAGLLDRNRAVALPDLPLRVGLITSRGSAAYHDFLATLGESGFGFRVALLHASVQGEAAERELVAALATADRLAARGTLDVLVLVRGGGARTDLAAFDSRAVAEAIATSPLPVLTGLGHEIDDTVADRVAHAALKTPTAVGELLVARLRDGATRTTTLEERLLRAAAPRLRTAGRALDRLERGIRGGVRRLGAAERRLDDLAWRLVRAGTRRGRDEHARLLQVGAAVARLAPRLLARGERATATLAARLAPAAAKQTTAAAGHLAALARLARSLAPERILARGFSITRTADGRLLRDAAAAPPGSRLVTQLLTGRLHSRVEEPTP